MPNLKSLINEEHENIHRAFCDLYKGFLPKDSTYYLSPFSIKKGKNIYGLIFGSGHPLGAYKFLEVCWKIDEEIGEANYNIDNDTLNNKVGDSLNLFKEDDIPTKLKQLAENIEKEIIDGNITDDKNITIYALRNGCLPKHTKETVQRLLKENYISRVDKSLRYSDITLKAPRKFKLRGLTV